jgi:hypothetical protein
MAGRKKPRNKLPNRFKRKDCNETGIDQYIKHKDKQPAYFKWWNAA